MSAQVYSPQWYRVAALRPRLAPQVRVRRQHTRGERWMVLADELTGRSVRLNRTAYALAARLDGERSLDQLWLGAQQGEDDPPTQDEVLAVLLSLQEAALLEVDAPAALALDRALALRDGDAPAQAASPRRGFNPLAWRLPLGHPGRLLDTLQPLQALAASRVMAWGGLLFGLLLLTLAAWQAPALQAFGQTWLDTPRFAALALLLYVPIKAVHELAHGLAVRQGGGVVREAGVTLMLGLPLPYVDASAAAGFARARDRMAVSGAGIVAELTIASVCLLAWTLLDDGGLRLAAFAALVGTTVSTLAFNANPLQRLDGYHLLCDAFGLPNLATRSRAFWRHQLLQRLRQAPADEPWPAAPGERPWLWAYAPLSWAWTVALAALGVVWLSRIAEPLAAAAALGLGVTVILQPAVRLYRELAQHARTQDTAARRWRRWRAGGLVIALLLTVLPWPHHLVAEGVVWPDDLAQLRAESAGVVAELLRSDGEAVAEGEVVMRLLNPDLAAAQAQAQARVQALEAEALQAQALGPREAERAASLRAQLEAAQAEAQQATERLAATELRARAAGRLALPPSADLEGHHQKEGSLVGQVLTGAPTRVRVAVPQDRAEDLRGDPPAISVRLADAPAQTRPGRWLRDGEGAVRQLPSAALSERHGGAWTTDPTDTEALRTLHPVVLVDVELQPTPMAEASHEPARLGTRAWVRFELGWAPLSWQLAQALRRSWQRHGGTAS